MHIEQAVEDISDLFLRVYLVLGAVPPEGATFITEEVSPASWDEYYQVINDRYWFLLLEPSLIVRRGFYVSLPAL